MIRTIEQWMEILAPLVRADEAADRVLGDVVAYPSQYGRRKNHHRDEDTLQIGNAMWAWHWLKVASRKPDDEHADRMVSTARSALAKQAA
jgi:hypothetical protein